MSNTHTIQRNNSILREIADIELDRLLDKVNDKFLHNKISGVTIFWGVPISNECIITNDYSGSPVPAAGYLPKDKKILIHPYLNQVKYKVPQYVLKYLIYHECLHFLYPSNNDENPHNDILMEHERKAPYRDKATKWLRGHNFPVLE